MKYHAHLRLVSKLQAYGIDGKLYWPRFSVFLVIGGSKFVLEGLFRMVSGYQWCSTGQRPWPVTLYHL